MMNPTVALVLCALLQFRLHGVSAQSATDLDDFSYLLKWAAIGDSYASGIGAGNVLDKSCSRYDGSYPNLINMQLSEDPETVDFTFIACSGAVTKQILSQANSLDGGKQMITISAGGNDAGLASILNNCIYTFGGLLSGGCDSALNNAQTVIDSPAFAASLDSVISAAKSKLASGGVIYYTGYAQFFDDSSNSCDSVSWHFWVNLFSRQYLTQARRTAMNTLVGNMNSALAAAVKRAGDQVVFVNYDNYVGYTGGRFCTPGVSESGADGANRIGLFFYEMKTSDSPLLQANSDFYYPDELRKRAADADSVPLNETVGGLFEAFIEEAIDDNNDPAINDDIANSDADAAIASLEGKKKHKVRADTGKPWSRGKREASQHWNTTMSETAVYSGSSRGPASASLHSTIAESPQMSTSLHQTGSSKPSSSASMAPSSGSTSSTQLISTGEVAQPLNSTDSTVRFPTGTASYLHMPYNSSSSSYLRSNATDSSRRYREMSRTIATRISQPTANSGWNSTATTSRYSIASSVIISGSLPYSRHPLSNGTAATLQHPTGTGVSIHNSTSCSLGFNCTTLANGTLPADISSLSNNTLLNLVKLPSQKTTVISKAIPDSVARVFHPQQGGHALIANLVMYQMSVRNAATLGITPPAENVTISKPLFDTPSPACDGSGTDSWVDRTAAVNAVSSFCTNYQNLGGHTGSSSTAVFGTGTLDYMSVSISWTDDYSIGPGDCQTWFSNVIDGCDTDTTTAKHGGGIGFANDATLSVNPLVMRQEWDKGKATDKQCVDVSSNSYIDQPTLASNIADFCTKSAAQNVVNSGTKFEQDYNPGTPDHVTLTTQWPSGIMAYQVFQDECNYYMEALMNDCSIGNIQTNPMNLKHGGSMADFNQVTYQITPNVSPRIAQPTAPTTKYSAPWKFFFVSFDVYGTGFADADYGSALLNQLRGCGAVSNWGFDYYNQGAGLSDDGLWEWHASGRLPIGTKPCIGRAINSAVGGPSP